MHKIAKRSLSLTIFGVEPFGVCMHKIKSLQTKFILLFFNLNVLMFNCEIALASTSELMSNRSNKTGLVYFLMLEEIPLISKCGGSCRFVTNDLDYAEI